MFTGCFSIIIIIHYSGKYLIQLEMVKKRIVMLFPKANMSLYSELILRIIKQLRSQSISFDL